MDFFCVSVIAFWNRKFALILRILRMVSDRKLNIIGLMGYQKYEILGTFLNYLLRK